MKKQIRTCCFFLPILPFLLWSQGTYYAGIDTGSTTFVTDLHNLIYPHTKISYDQFDETNIANFASRDTTGGQKIVTCVYSGENYVYTAPFAWTTFSREHTYCHSWMPTHPSTSGPEYSDQHHLFPTNQNNANGVRSNHPLGIVTTVTSSYLSAKYGKNSSGENVYEPRDSHKGDAARALLYMTVCYNGVDGNDWTFNYLNTVTLPPLNEAAQDVDLLIQWHEQDPPDAWEIARNDYIESIQGNRNPFVDHPEYADVIDFNTLTKKSGVAAGEPTNYPSGYNTPTLTSNSIKVTWSDPGGAILATGYLLKANTVNSFADPVSGNEYSDQTNLAGGSAEVNVAYGTGECTFTDLAPSTSYYFKLYPYNGNTASRMYKTAGYPSSLQQEYTTTTSSVAEVRGLFFSEYFEGASNNKALEIFNGISSGTAIDLNRLRIRLYSNGASTPTTTTQLNLAEDGSTGTLAFGNTFVIYHSSFELPNMNIPNAPQSRRVASTSPSNFNGNDAVELQYDTTGSGAWKTMDVFGQIGSDPGSAWGSGNTSTVNNGIIRKSSVNTGRSNDVFTPSDEFDGRDASASTALPVTTFGQHTCTTPLPVELTSFTAVAKKNSVELIWSTAAELNNYGFEVQKSEVSGHSDPDLSGEESRAWTRVGFVEGSGTSNSPREYSFTDKNLKAGRYFYRLKQIDSDGKFEYSKEVEVSITVPKIFTLEQNYPNPFNPVTTIGFTLKVSGHTTLKIYDVIGREVAVLANEHLEAGVPHQRTFNGSGLSSGIYFYTLVSGNFSATKKLFLMK